MKKMMILLAMVLTFQVQASVKVGLVNIQKIISEIKEGKAVNSTLKKSFEKKQKQIQAEEGKIKKLQEDYKKQSVLWSDAVKAKKQTEIQMKIQEVRQVVMGYQQEIQKQEADLKKPILEKLKPVIDQVSKKAGVAMTFELTASPVVYAQSKVDLSSDVVKAYDKKYAKKKK